MKWAVTLFGRVLFTLLGPVRVRDRNKQPTTGGLLILANHRSDCDPIVVQLASPRHVYFMAKSELWEIGWLKKFLDFWGAFPVNRGAPDRAAIKKAVELLKAGHCVCIFPEGKLSETGRLQEILPGALLVAKMAGTPFQCLGIQRSEKIIPYGSLVPRPAWGYVTATWGEVNYIDSTSDVRDFAQHVHTELRTLTNEI
jgi:1-acyl-sn-glycerol-3-phosphate acyltransferase